MQAMQLVRTQRPGSVQTSKQRKFVESFERHLQQCSAIFSIPVTPPTADSRSKSTMTLRDVLNRQKLVLHGEEARSLRYIPKLIDIVCTKLQHQLRSRSTTATEISIDISDTPLPGSSAGPESDTDKVVVQSSKVSTTHIVSCYWKGW